MQDILTWTEICSFYKLKKQKQIKGEIIKINSYYRMISIVIKMSWLQQHRWVTINSKEARRVAVSLVMKNNKCLEQMPYLLRIYVKDLSL